jgi:hypothetical protein
MRLVVWLMVGAAGLLTLASAPAWGDDAPSPAADRDAHAQLQQILNGSQYTAWRLRQEGEMSAPASGKWSQFVDEQIEKIREFIDTHFQKKRTNAASSPIPARGGNSLPTFLHLAAWVIVGAIVIYLAVVLFKIIGLRPSANVARVLSQEQIREAMESGNALALDKSQWMEQARRLAGEQDFRAMYRALYLALLSGLHAAGKIEHNRNRTNWIYVEHYRGPAPERARFSELTELFDRVWYGRKPAEGGNLDQLRLDVAMLTRGEGGA